MSAFEDTLVRPMWSKMDVFEDRSRNLGTGSTPGEKREAMIFFGLARLSAAVVAVAFTIVAVLAVVL
jgi:hypothetical protein